jgi:hypothetical protein
MLDMGGAPSAGNDKTLIRTVNASKNSKLQAVAFDFEVLVRDSFSTAGADADAASGEGDTNANANADNKSVSSYTTTAKTLLQPDLAKINEVASLLNVNMDTGRGTVGVGGQNQGRTPSAVPNTKNTKNKNSSNPLLDNDVRSKYAAKLKNVGIGGGIHAIDQTKSQVEGSLQRGDAVGHLSARQVAIDHDVDTGIIKSKSNKTGGSRWMALPGTGRLLSYLTHRSIRIALLPSSVRKSTHKANPPTSNATEKDDDDDYVCPEEESMRDLAQQLKKDVVIDVIVPNDRNNNNSMEDAHTETTRSLQKNVLDTLGIDPNRILVVSDQDVYLKAGRDLGMLTCRLQPKNSRRGNITTHYTVPSTVDVRGVIDEINGISFNAVLNR